MSDTFEIVDLGAGGDGIAKLPDGRTAFIPLTVTGDIVRADVDAQGRGNLLEIIQPSPLRAFPPCPHFGICGGCALQHVDTITYQDFKKRQVLEFLSRAGVQISPAVESIFIPSGTRRRANFATRITKGRAVMGFHERKSATILNTPDCLLISDDVRRVMTGMKEFLPLIAGEGQKMDVLIQCVEGRAEVALTGRIAPGWEAQQALSDAMRTLDLARISLRARDYESYEILLEAHGFFKAFDSLIVNLAPGAFLQPSDAGERALVDCVKGGAGDASCIADLFCGNGTFTGALMKGRDVHAYDSAQDAIAALTRAGANAQVRNLFKNPLGGDQLHGVDCVVMDPPRAGAAAQVEALSNSGVGKVVYVSCNPQSFARDAAVLTGAGYKIETLTIVDQFIWSPHTELVAAFTLT